MEEKEAQNNTKNYQDNYSDDSDSDTDDSIEEVTDSCYHIKNLKLNFDGLILLLDK